MGHRNGSGLGELPVSGHASNSDQHPERAFSPNLLAQTTHFQNLGVSQQPLARECNRGVESYTNFKCSQGISYLETMCAEPLRITIKAGAFC